MSAEGVAREIERLRDEAQRVACENRVPEGYRKGDREYLPIEFVERRESLVRVRAGVGEVQSWRRCAMLEARSLSELIRAAVNSYVAAEGRKRGNGGT